MTRLRCARLRFQEAYRRSRLPRGCALNRTDALDVLRSSRFEAFVGVTESAELDFKGEPYQLEDERGKLELAKDVAALANAGGGIIVIGVRTTLPETSRVEVARDIRLIPVSVVDLRQCRNLARSRVYPDVGGLDVAFHSSSHDPTRGLLAIDVPPQAATARPFLVHSPLVGDKTVGWLVGLPTRHRDATDHASIEELHRRIRDGDTATLSSIRDALSRLEAVPEQVVAPSVTAAERADQLVERTFPENAEDDLIDTSMPHLVLVFAPSGGQIRDFLEDGGARKLVAFPPTTRSQGWHLRTEREPDVISGGQLRVRSGDWLRVELTRDGELIVVAALPNFIARGSTFEPHTIQALALVEFIYNAVAFYGGIVRDWILPRPTAISCRLELRKARWGEDGRYALHLSPYPTDDARSGIPLPGGAPE